MSDKFKFTKDELRQLKALAPSEEWFDRYPYFHNLIDRIEAIRLRTGGVSICELIK